MELRERLQRLGYTATQPKPAFAPPPPRPRRVSAWPVEQVVGGAIVEAPHGCCFVAMQELAGDHAHGDRPVGEFHRLPKQALAWLWREAEAANLDPGAIAFIDTETTGLAGGTGTYVFLVGVGRFTANGFRLRQYFMRDFAEERPMLQALAAELREIEGIVSFNGKAFDLPLIETRYAMHRLRHPLAEVCHLDLLFPARRLWRTRLDRCNLGTLETAVLGVSRDGLPDAPGWLIPSLYFDYVRHGDARPLRRVFTHNALDILAMVGLTIRLARQFEDPFAAGWAHGEDLFGLGRAFEDLHEPERAALCYERALALPLAGEERQRLLARIAALYRRLERQDAAAAIWERLIDAGSTSLFPYVELAKHHEHRRRDPAQASRYVERALTLAQLQALAGEPGAETARAELEHRLARLRRKRGWEGASPANPPTPCPIW